MDESTFHLLPKTGHFLRLLLRSAPAERSGDGALAERCRLETKRNVQIPHDRVALEGRGKLTGGVSHRLGRTRVLAPAGASLIDPLQCRFQS